MVVTIDAFRTEFLFIFDWGRAFVFLTTASSRTEIGATLRSGPIAEPFAKFPIRLTTTTDGSGAYAARTLVLRRIGQ